MNKWISLTMMVTLISFLSGCSNEVKNFIPNYAQESIIRNNIAKKITIKTIMPKNDKNAVMCRMNGNIYLPNKMTYSQYVEDAFKKSLVLANRLADEGRNSHGLLITLTKVDFNSAIGKWYINADVKVNNNVPVEIKNTTSFGTEFFADAACSSVANTFDRAVGNFVDEVLSNSTVVNHIKS